VYLEQKRYPEARSYLERAAAAHGPEAAAVRAEELFQLASVSYAEKKWEQAASELQEALVADPHRPLLYTRLLDLQLGRAPDPAGAESTTVRYLRLCGRSGMNLRDAALVHYQNRAYAESERLARQAVGVADSLVDAHALVVRSVWKQADASKALVELAGPLERYPRSAELWSLRAFLLIDTGARTQALAAADRAVELAPRSFEAHQSRQKALALHGRLDEAMREIEITRGITNDPEEQRILLRQQRTLRSMMGIQGRIDPAGEAAADTTTSP
jgi:tetratricopeptide (TPR) repeat protein